MFPRLPLIFLPFRKYRSASTLLPSQARRHNGDRRTVDVTVSRSKWRQCGLHSYKLRGHRAVEFHSFLAVQVTKGSAESQSILSVHTWYRMVPYLYTYTVCSFVFVLSVNDSKCCLYVWFWNYLQYMHTVYVFTFSLAVFGPCESRCAFFMPFMCRCI